MALNAIACHSLGQARLAEAFYGVHPATMDAKGRVALPLRVRELLADGFSGRLVITSDIKDDCLLLYPHEVFAGLRDQFLALPNVSDFNRALQRRFVGQAGEVGVDASGRILIPPELRRVAQLNRDLVLMGQGKKFEIWGREVRDAKSASERQLIATTGSVADTAGIVM